MSFSLKKHLFFWRRQLEMGKKKKNSGQDDTIPCFKSQILGWTMSLFDHFWDPNRSDKPECVCFSTMGEALLPVWAIQSYTVALWRVFFETLGGYFDPFSGQTVPTETRLRGNIWGKEWAVQRYIHIAWWILKMVAIITKPLSIQINIKQTSKMLQMPQAWTTCYADANDMNIRNSIVVKIIASLRLIGTSCHFSYYWQGKQCWLCRMNKTNTTTHCFLNTWNNLWGSLHNSVSRVLHEVTWLQSIPGPQSGASLDCSMFFAHVGIT